MSDQQLLMAADAGDIPDAVKPKPMGGKSVSQPPSYDTIKKQRERDQRILLEQHRKHSRAHGATSGPSSSATRQPHHSQKQQQRQPHHGQGTHRHRLDTDSNGKQATEMLLSRKTERRSTPPTGRRTFREKIDTTRIPPDFKYPGGMSDADFHRSASMGGGLAENHHEQVKSILAKRGYVTMRSVSDESEPTPWCTPCRGLMITVILVVVIVIVLLATGVIVNPRPSPAVNNTMESNLPFEDVLPTARTVRKVKRSCDIMVCTSPNCACSNTRVPPYPMPIGDVPQLVMLSFDNRVTDLNYHYFEELFDGTIKNPNDCPIKATFFVSHHHTNYRNVQKLYRDHHEISSLAVTSAPTDWEGEVLGQREILRNYAYIRSDQIVGFRAPELKPGGDTMARALQENGFLYDSSMIETGHPPRYPYTFEYRKESFCHVQPCPYDNGYPGLWEIPVIQWQHYRTGDLFGSPYEYTPFNFDDAKKYFQFNFNRHYEISRAPFNINIHTRWFDDNPFVFDALTEFIQETLELGDVYFVKQSQAIQWMKTPIPSQNATLFDLFDCPSSITLPGPEPCFIGEANNCVYDVYGEKIAMQTCAPCPPHFPFVRNTDGELGE